MGYNLNKRNEPFNFIQFISTKKKQFIQIHLCHLFLTPFFKLNFQKKKNKNVESNKGNSLEKFLNFLANKNYARFILLINFDCLSRCNKFKLINIYRMKFIIV